MTHHHRKSFYRHSTTALLGFFMAGDLPATNTADAIVAYDYGLCVTAQRILLNSQPDEVEIVINRAAIGGGFGTLQMDVDASAGTVVVASLTEQVDVGGEKLNASVWCKMINQERVNDTLGLQLQSQQSCRAVNEHTYRETLELLSDEQREAYDARGKPLRFRDDHNAGAGAAWLPAVVNEFVESRDDALYIQAPTVQVDWDTESRDWYKGTYHCKFITMAAMQRWMTGGALNGAVDLFPRADRECTAPSSMTSTIGSCLQFFGPADAQICTDYSGSGWTVESASAQCGERHATEAAWLAANRKYVGIGGIFSSESCAEREAVREARRSPVGIAKTGDFGTCVFRCNHGDETLWHSLTPDSLGEQGGAAMTARCDLFIPGTNQVIE
jgi:hypothetical protein